MGRGIVRTFVEYEGQKIANLIILDGNPRHYDADLGRKILCLCVCGNPVIIEGRELFRKEIISCGCGGGRFNSISTIGTDYPEYQNFKAMHRRCSGKLDTKKKKKYYQDKGIKVCERWFDFRFFLQDMGPKPSPKHTIDRINSDGDYEPSNCRWATNIEQAENRRSSKKAIVDNIEFATISAAARHYNKRPMTVFGRIKHGWTIEESLKIPVDRKNNNVRLKNK